MKLKEKSNSAKFSTLLLFSLLIIIFTSIFSGCINQLNHKVIVGAYGPWKTPFEILIMEEEGDNFSGIFKWNECWSYCEGKYFANDSIIFEELDTIIGFGVVLNGRYPGKIESDSIHGKWIHQKDQNSGNPYVAKIVEFDHSISNIEYDVWKLYKAEMELKTKFDQLNNQIHFNKKYAIDNNIEPVDTDSLESLKGQFAMDLLNSFMPIYKKYYHCVDSNIVQTEIDKRIVANFRITSTMLNDLQKSRFLSLIEKNPEGTVIHYRLSKTFHEHKLREILYSKKENMNEVLFKERTEFFKNFLDKDIHPKEALGFLFDFTYGVYQFDKSYYTRLMEKTNFIKKHYSEEEINVLEKVISRFDQESKISIGALAPDFSAKSLGGEDVNLSSFKGKVVSLEFWASWCGPCREATPKLKEIYKQFAKDLVMVGIAFEDSSAAAKYVGENGINWLNIVATDEMGDKYRDLYAINGVPTMFLIDKEGKIAFRTHPLDTELKDKIEALLDK